MSALSIPALSGYEAVTSLKSEVLSTQQQNTVQSATDSSKSATGLPRFSSTHIYIDPTSSRVVFETRDPQTGKLTNQLPSSLQLRAYQLQQGISSTAASTISTVQSEQLAVKPIAASGKTVIAA